MVRDLTEGEPQRTLVRYTLPMFISVVFQQFYNMTDSMIAVPSILQQSFVSVGNTFIQGLVNSYGSGVIAGYSAAIRLNTYKEKGHENRNGV